MEQGRIKRDYKGIWIPKAVWDSDKLSLMEKVLFVEIHSLDNEDGCYATNAYFANFFALSDRQIRRHIVSLKNKGLISISIKNDTERIIRVIGKYSRSSEAQLQDMAKMRHALIDHFSVSKLSTPRHRGWTKMSGEGGHK